MSLAAVPKGARVFLDAPVFLHHFTGTSLECRALLERCERSEVRGVTSALVLAVVAASLARMEAAQASDEGTRAPRPEATRPDDVRPKNPARALEAAAPEEAVAKIPLMGIEVLPLDLRALLASSSLRLELGAGVAAALAVAVAREAGADALATTATDLDRAEGLRVYRPSDTE